MYERVQQARRVGRRLFAASLCSFVLVLTGCRAVPPSETAVRLRVDRPVYSIYSVTQGSADELDHWVSAELREFEKKYGVTPGRGFIIAAEPNSQTEVAEEMAPGPFRHFCLLPARAMRPSASMFAGFARFRRPDGQKSDDRWACELTTMAEFRRAARVAHEREWAYLGQVSEGSAAECVMMPFFAVAFAQWEGIDRKLMLLQRHEVLWSVWIATSLKTDEERAAALAEVKQKANTEWDRLCNTAMTD